MKKPIKPSEPRKPNEPMKYVAAPFLLERQSNTITIDIVVINEFAKKHNCKPESIFIDVHTCMNEIDDYEVELWVYTSDPFLNPDYERELEVYNKKMMRYQERYKKYLNQLATYNTELEKWYKFCKQKRYQEAKRLVESWEELND